MSNKSIIVTEKPSVARTFAKTLGVTNKEEGYFENDSWIITWCLGHLVTMSYPEKYNEDLKAWSYDTLPFLPDHYLYEVIDENRKQFNIIKKLYNRADVSRIYYAGDAAREGLYIQMLVRKMAFSHKPTLEERVVWIDSQTDAEIKRGIKEAKNLSEYAHLSDAGYLRAIEDYAVGINLTRAFSLKYGRALYLRKPIAVGRVMTCVLAMIVDREREIRNFKPTAFYKVIATSKNGNASFTWKANKSSKIYEKVAPYLYDETGFKNETMATSFANGLGPNLIIKSIESKTEKKYAPLLYNLAELQNDCSKRFKLSPDKTLEILEKLYMEGLITYPRTDARVLSSAVADEIQKNLGGIARVGNNSSYINRITNPCGIKNSRYVDDSKISDHYALVPTGEKLSALNGLNDVERGVYDLIEKRFISIFMPPAVYEKTSVMAVDDKRDEQFFLTGSVLKEEGYTEVLGKQADDGILNIPFKEGDVIPVDYNVTKGETKPKPRYTSGSIILAMENAGKLIEDEALREQIKGQGIGTSATRAEILKKLVAINDITLNGKTQVLQPTDLGELVVDIVRDAVPEMTVPEMTATWETKLDAVATGKMSRAEYQKEIDDYVRNCVDIIKDADINDALKQKSQKTQTDTKSAPVKSSDVATYLNVSFDDKEKVKALGARWDGNKKAWYVPKGKSLDAFKPYMNGGKAQTSIKKIWLDVPYDDKDEAKKLGARWDMDKKAWYIMSSADKNKFAKWLD